MNAYNIRAVAWTLFVFLTSVVMVENAVGKGDDAAGAWDIKRLEEEFKTPPREFSLIPFWFWNDELSNDEIAKQIESFEERGVYAFTIHPRIGLPKDSGWMSEKLLAAMRFALREAQKRNMFVMLYDEGMYPSGSSAGQVVAENKQYAARGFLRVELEPDGEKPRDKNLVVEDDWNLVDVYTRPNGTKVAVYDAPSRGVIRGLHYIGDENKNPREFSPPAADLLNPNAVDAFIRLVYQRYYDEFEQFFRDGVILGIFTDEPSILGRGPGRDMKLGNLNALPTINKYLGFDMKPFLLDLWENVDEGSAARRVQYDRAVKLALEEVYYGRIAKWCLDHNTALAGHPEGSADVGVLREFQIPGQDIVWRYIEPGEKAFDPIHSPMAKVASSVALHTGARRNLNEVFGAYGYDFTYDEMVWIINWCVVRGQNMFLPHAFYYSIRGPRKDERPPDVGPNSPWWNEYKIFADYCARLCWLNTDSKVVAPIAILVDSSQATAWGTKALMQNQLDFNYLELRSLKEDAVFRDGGIAVKDAFYRAVVLPPKLSVDDDSKKILEDLALKGRVVRWGEDSPNIENAPLVKNDGEAIGALRDLVGDDARVMDGDAMGLRVRHVVKGNVDFYFLFNEVEKNLVVALTFAADREDAKLRRWNPLDGSIEELERDPANPGRLRLSLEPWKTTILAFER